MLEDCRFHHIGYAVKDILLTAEYYLKVGWNISNIQEDTIQNTKIAFLSRDGFPLIELVAPIDDKSPIVKTLEKVGVTTYHICYEVDDIDIAVLNLKKQRFLPLFRPVEAIALENRKFAIYIIKM